MKPFLFALTVVIMTGTAIAQQRSADEAALLAIEEKWDAASVKGDTVTLSVIWTDGFLSTSPEGKVRNKAEMLKQITSGEMKVLSAKVDEMKIVVYGDAAIVSGRWSGKFVLNGKTLEGVERFTDMFVREKGQWRCAASHASAMR